MIDCLLLLNVVAYVVIVLVPEISFDARCCVMCIYPMLVWVDDVE